MYIVITSFIDDKKEKIEFVHGPFATEMEAIKDFCKELNYDRVAKIYKLSPMSFNLLEEKVETV